jgi:hypothetical protein
MIKDVIFRDRAVGRRDDETTQAVDHPLNGHARSWRELRGISLTAFLNQSHSIIAQHDLPEFKAGNGADVGFINRLNTNII